MRAAPPRLRHWRGIRADLCLRVSAHRCPIAGYSRTLPNAVGAACALGFYLTDRRLTAHHALAFGLVHAVSRGVGRAKERALHFVGTLAVNQPAVDAVLASRCSIDTQLLADEVVAHAECLTSNGGGGFVQAGQEDAATSQQVPRVKLVFNPSARQTVIPSTGVLYRPSIIARGWMLHIASVHQQLQLGSQPLIALCHGETQRSGMLVPCHATAVLAHADTTFTLTQRDHASLMAYVPAQQRLHCSNAPALGRPAFRSMPLPWAPPF